MTLGRSSTGIVAVKTPMADGVTSACAIATSSVAARPRRIPTAARADRRRRVSGYRSRTTPTPRSIDPPVRVSLRGKARDPSGRSGCHRRPPRLLGVRTHGRDAERQEGRAEPGRADDEDGMGGRLLHPPWLLVRGREHRGGGPGDEQPVRVRQTECRSAGEADGRTCDGTPSYLVHPDDGPVPRRRGVRRDRRHLDERLLARRDAVRQVGKVPAGRERPGQASVAASRRVLERAYRATIEGWRPRSRRWHRSILPSPKRRGRRGRVHPATRRMTGTVAGASPRRPTRITRGWARLGRGLDHVASDRQVASSSAAAPRSRTEDEAPPSRWRSLEPDAGRRPWTPWRRERVRRRPTSDRVARSGQAANHAVGRRRPTGRRRSRSPCRPAPRTWSRDRLDDPRRAGDAERPAAADRPSGFARVKRGAASQWPRLTDDHAGRVGSAAMRVLRLHGEARHEARRRRVPGSAGRTSPDRDRPR
jgi:hypothetical protein